MAKTTNFVGVPCKKMKPTRGHRPAIWENILGTVYALNDKYEMKYFDYDYKAAAEFAGVNPYRDMRLAKHEEGAPRWFIRFNQLVLWIKINY